MSALLYVTLSRTRPLPGDHFGNHLALVNFSKSASPILTFHLEKKIIISRQDIAKCSFYCRGQGVLTFVRIRWMSATELYNSISPTHYHQDSLLECFHLHSQSPTDTVKERLHARLGSIDDLCILVLYD